MVLLNFFATILLFPLCCGFYEINPNEAMILEAFGKPIKIVREQGLHWYWPFGVSFKRVTMALNTIRIRGTSVPDLQGSPLNISVVITYVIN